jgi:hypothetical protein
MGHNLVEVRELIEKNWKDLQDAWDRKYPSNPISSQEEDDDEDEDEGT